MVSWRSVSADGGIDVSVGVALGLLTGVSVDVNVSLGRGENVAVGATITVGVGSGLADPSWQPASMITLMRTTMNKADRILTFIVCGPAVQAPSEISCSFLLALMLDNSEIGEVLRITRRDPHNAKYP